jgi:uncharacterized Ntn-hydrolase superfamily protein
VTFSLAARCPSTGLFGMVISSSSAAVAARCLHLRLGVGAAASQNITDPRLGTALLDLMAQGRSAPDAIAELVDREPTAGYRQLTAVDAKGRTGVHSGAHTLGIHAQAQGNGVVSAGNMLADPKVVVAMVESFEANDGSDLADRLLDAIDAGLEAGGEAGPVHSAGLVVMGQAGWPATDLRVDWHEQPIAELRRLWQLWQPLEDDYQTRGVDPSSAPRYGVRGDE